MIINNVINDMLLNQGAINNSTDQPCSFVKDYIHVEQQKSYICLTTNHLHKNGPLDKDLPYGFAIIHAKGSHNRPSPLHVKPNEWRLHSDLMPQTQQTPHIEYNQKTNNAHITSEDGSISIDLTNTNQYRLKDGKYVSKKQLIKFFPDTKTIWNNRTTYEIKQKTDNEKEFYIFKKPQFEKTIFAEGSRFNALLNEYEPTTKTWTENQYFPCQSIMDQLYLNNNNLDLKIDPSLNTNVLESILEASQYIPYYLDPTNNARVSLRYRAIKALNTKMPPFHRGTLLNKSDVFTRVDGSLLLQETLLVDTTAEMLNAIDPAYTKDIITEKSKVIINGNSVLYALKSETGSALHIYDGSQDDKQSSLFQINCKLLPDEIKDFVAQDGVYAITGKNFCDWQYIINQGDVKNLQKFCRIQETVFVTSILKHYLTYNQRVLKFEKNRDNKHEILNFHHDYEIQTYTANFQEKQDDTTIIAIHNRANITGITIKNKIPVASMLMWDYLDQFFPRTRTHDEKGNLVENRLLLPPWQMPFFQAVFNWFLSKIPFISKAKE